jgi:hypothetical protein
MERSAAELIQSRRFPHESCARRVHFAVKHNATVLRARSEKFARHSEPGAPNFGYPPQNVQQNSPVNFPVSREFGAETGSQLTASSVSQPVPSLGATVASK